MPAKSAGRRKKPKKKPARVLPKSSRSSAAPTKEIRRKSDPDFRQIVDEPKKAAFEPLRWTLSRAASEFGLSPKTVAQRVKASGILPGADHRFSTVDIHRAVCTDYDRDRARKMKEDADAAELKNARGRKELVDVPDFVQRYEVVYTAMRQIILGCSMSDPDKDRLLGELHKLHSR